MGEEQGTGMIQVEPTRLTATPLPVGTVPRSQYSSTSMIYVELRRRIKKHQPLLNVDPIPFVMDHCAK